MSGSVWAVIAGGGTAGHVHPALAIAEEFVSRGRDRSSLHFVGSQRGQEVDLVPEHGYELTALPGRGIARKLSAENLRSAWALTQATRQAFTLLRRLRPKVIVSVGGYASVPCAVAAIPMRIPLIVAEQNSVPGAANRMVGRFARASAVSFPGTDLPSATVTGNPLRPEILAVDRDKGRVEARRRLGVPPDAHFVAVFGGSLGAKRINQSLIDALPQLAQLPNLAIRHIVGARDWDLFGSTEAPDALAYQAIRYEEDMASVYAAADLLLCRAGATSVAEIAAIGVPSILVPLPGAPGDHQTLNARALSDHQAAELVPDAELTPERLTSALADLLGSESRLSTMEQRARELGRRDAACRIADLCEEHANE